MGRGSYAWSIGCLGALIVGVVAVLIWSVLAVPLNFPLLGNLRYRCTLGLTQTNASLTVKGPLSGRECRRLLDQTSLLPVRLVRVSHATSAPVICSFKERYTTVTFRGPSLLLNIGDSFCTLVRQILAFQRRGPAPLQTASVHARQRSPASGALSIESM